VAEWNPMWNNINLLEKKKTIVQRRRGFSPPLLQETRKMET